MGVTMISRAVEISIAGGVAETEDVLIVLYYSILYTVYVLYLLVYGTSQLFREPLFKILVIYFLSGRTLPRFGYFF